MLERRPILAMLVLALVTGAGAGIAPPAEGGGRDVYVALGDSYTSGPLIANPKGEPADCGRSDHNYPTLVANKRKPDRFIDVSCGSAQTKHMTEPQTELPLGGTNPPQFDALSRRVDLVTIGIGGNDMGFGEIVETCAGLAIESNGEGAPCTEHYHRDGRDEIAARLREVVAPRLAKVIRGIHRRSPRARLVAVGYPDPVPQPPGCYPEVPLAEGDLPWLHRVAERLSATVRRKALRGGAEFVDLIPGSLGHDMCQPPGTRWYEGIAPTSPAYPAHPNARGMKFAALEVLKVLRRAPRNDFKILDKRARRDGSIALRVKLPARGRLRARALARPAGAAGGERARRAVRYARGNRFAQRARRLRLLLRPGGAGRRALEEHGRLRVRVAVRFRPIAGRARTKRVRVGPLGSGPR